MMYFVHKQSFVHSHFYKCWLLELPKKWVFSENLAPRTGFRSPGKEFMLLRIVLRSKCGSCFDSVGSAIKNRRFHVNIVPLSNNDRRKMCSYDFRPSVLIYLSYLYVCRCFILFPFHLGCTAGVPHQYVCFHLSLKCLLFIV